MGSGVTDLPNGKGKAEFINHEWPIIALKPNIEE